MRTFTLDQQRRNSKTVYMLHEIQSIGPARRLATQQVGYDQTKKINRGGANYSHTYDIIPVLAPNEFNIRTTTDEFNVTGQQRMSLTSYPGQIEELCMY